DVTPVAGLVTTEAAGTASFTVQLESQPTADVVIPVASSDLSEGTVSAASLTFTVADWNVPQTVTVTGVTDAVDDGDIAYTITLGAPSSSDAVYAAIDPADVAVTNTDDNTAAIDVTPTSGLETTESGGTATFTVVLKSQPTGAVVIGIGSSNPYEGTAAPAALAFTAANWSVPQTVTVTGAGDLVADGAVAYSVVLDDAMSVDPNYSGMDVADVAVTNNDDDVAGIQVTPTAGLGTTEAGGTASFTVVLTSQPTADVVVPVASTHTAEGTVSASTLTFTPFDWHVPQTVTVTGADDAVDDGDIAYGITVGAPSTTDLVYAAIDPDDVAVTNAD